MFGLHPWDVDRLTITELNIYLKWANEYQQSRSES
jgi:hypothetical protein